MFFFPNIFHFWATVCKTVRPMLSNCCLSCPVCPVCDIGVLWPNGSTDEDETWHAGSLGPSHIVLDGNLCPPSPKGHSPPIFGPYLLWPYGSMDQDATWYEGRPRPKRHCVRWGPSSPPPQRGQSPPNFRPMSIVPKRLDGSRCHLVWR